ncbi:MAG TPA: hypothetical protein VNU19_00780 [Candidatus Acidoferrum sp.]|jgi:hypothetical protein|nr:hypothetical protein [Candidatus Acidoferrum sp.]
MAHGGVSPEASRWRRLAVGVAMGAMSAALFSVFALLTGGKELAPGIAGCFLGMLIFVATPMGRPMVEGVDIWRSTKQFSYQQRREIARAVRRGRAVNDPVLAEAAARRALNLGNMMSVLQPWWLVACVVLLSIAGLLQGSLGGFVFAAVAIGLWLLLRPRRRRVAQHAERAAGANRDLTQGDDPSNGT